jgi:hypothetical protein
MKEFFNGDFYLPKAVESELIEKPLKSKKFKFEALQVARTIKQNVWTIAESPKISLLAEELMNLANHTFRAKGNWLNIVHYAEMEVIATAVIMNSQAVVIDERTTKLLIEDPQYAARVLERKTGSRVFVDKQSVEKLQKWTKNIKVLRSAEFVMMAYEKGVLNEYVLDGNDLGAKDTRKTLVESLLWGLKLRGCAISRQELNEIVAIEMSIDEEKQKI